MTQTEATEQAQAQAPAPEPTDAIVAAPRSEPEPSEPRPAIVLAPAAIQDAQGVAVFSSQDSFTTAQRMAKALAASSLVPSQYQGNVPNVLIAMEVAHRIGTTVFAVMQNMDIINGRPSFRATFLIGTVNASRRFTPIRFRWMGERGKLSWGCEAVATDRETGEECVGADITMQMAKDEGWIDRKGSKWKTMPKQMLMYRAAAFWARIFAPELSLGMHTSDEIEDFDPRPRIEHRPTRGRIGPSPLAERLAEQRLAEQREAEPTTDADQPASDEESQPDDGEQS